MENISRSISIVVLHLVLVCVAFDKGNLADYNNKSYPNSTNSLQLDVFRHLDVHRNLEWPWKASFSCRLVGEHLKWQTSFQMYSTEKMDHPHFIDSFAWKMIFTSILGFIVNNLHSVHVLNIFSSCRDCHFIVFLYKKQTVLCGGGYLLYKSMKVFQETLQ